MNVHERIVLLLEAAKTSGSLSKRSDAVNQKNTDLKEEIAYTGFLQFWGQRA
jgi:hypothetical protein